MSGPREIGLPRYSVAGTEAGAPKPFRRVRTRTAETMTRPDGWVLTISVLERDDGASCIELRTARGTAGARVQIGHAEIEAAQRALNELRSLLGRPQ